MHIALNAQLLSFRSSYRQAGISRLISATIQGLQAVDQENDYTVFVGDRGVPAGYLTNQRWRMAPSRFAAANRPSRILWEQTALPWSAWRTHADLLHALAFVGPLASPCPLVVTVYDLTFVLFPDAFNRVNRTYLETMTRASMRRARRVIAISQSTKRDLVRLMGVPAERVDVVYPGLEPGLARVSDAAALADFHRRYQLPARFVLFVGTLEPRKNVANLVRAYAALRQRGVRSHALVLAGSKGWRYESIFAAIAESGVAEHIILPGYVDRADLPLWYSAADALVYPSLYEGFGLPVLEAMACGAPVITSNVSSLPEVAGDAALLVDPDDVGGLADAMACLVGDEDLRRTLAARGQAQAATFTIEQMARATRAVYEETLA